nr:unnamed protein product [Digitaria exilis]
MGLNPNPKLRPNTDAPNQIKLRYHLPAPPLPLAAGWHTSPPRSSPAAAPSLHPVACHHAAEQVLREEDEARPYPKGQYSAAPPPLEVASKAQTLLDAVAHSAQVVREHYLRDDIYCGFAPCSTCDAAAERKLDAAAAAILVVDTNVVLHQIDLLENPAIEDVVLLSVVLDEVKNKNLAVFNRIKALCTNKARRFYVFANEQHSHNLNKIFLVPVESYVRSLAQPGLLDLVVIPTSGDVTMEDVEDHRPSKKKVIYSEHKPMSEITSGLRCGIYHQGKLRVNRYNPFEAYVGSESIGDEIVIRGRSNMNRAFDGDIVAVELLPQDQWHESKSFIADDDEEEEEEDVHLAPNSADDAPRNTSSTQSTVGSSAPSVSSRPLGRVVGIIKRNWNSYCGSLQPMPMPAGSGGVAHALFVSKDRRIPKIRIQTRQLENLVNKRIVVAVDSWDVLSRYPSGHYVRTIGDIGDKETETEASILTFTVAASAVVLIENDINTRPFSTQVLACLPPLPWTLSSEDLANPNRQDLRHVRVFSVDPPGCRDIDDALHCTLLPNGNFEVGVHIADVTNFVHPGTPLDEEAAQRGTSVYLVGQRIDMLPKPLTEDVCSLRADVERLAFSVIWEMTPDADIISTRYTKSVIKSCAAMSYVEAQARMDDSRLVDPLTVDLRNLNSLAKIMRQRRCDRGALTLASAEVKFEIDSETHDPLDIGIYQIREANQMIEEFMLAANISVAEKILTHFPLCSLLRRHPSPTKEMLEPLLRTASSVGLNLDVSSSKALAESLDNAKTNDPYFNKLIRILATRCMTQAVYFCSGDLTFSEYYHYGLAASLYTHFTSPIRRYADVVVHRLLAAALDIAKLPPIFQDGPQLTGIADNLNYRHRNAQMASRASVELHTLIYFRTRPTDTEARIVKVKANGFIVFVPKFGIEGPIYLTPKGDKGGDWVVDEVPQRVTKPGTNISYAVLQTVRIHMEVVEPQPHRPKLQLTLI